MKFIDTFLNKITMYRLALYELIFLLLAAAILGFFGLIPYSPIFLGYSVMVIFAVTWVVNKIFAYFFNAPSNPESTYITALILALIISPPQTFLDWRYLALAGWAAAWSMASKYIFAFRDKHLFNPAAFGVAVTALFLNQSASWWVGSLWMLPFVIIGGLLVARKIQRLEMVAVFGAVALATITILGFSSGAAVLHTIQQSLFSAPLLFLGTVMLTEPLTTPPTRFLRLWYAVLVGFLFAPEVHVGSFYFTPELALLVGNLFVFLVSPKVKLLLTLKDRIQLSPGTYEFVFSTNRKMRFTPGQYLEWTLPHQGADARGIRRFFTIASAPSDPDFRIGVKFYKPSSTYKKSLLALKKGDGIVASQLSGDFSMPADKKKKLVFIAGGIGVTPFRSMLQDLLNRKEKRDIVLFYTNKTIADTAYVDVLDHADTELGVRIVPVFTSQTPEDQNRSGFPDILDYELITREVPDFKDRYYYLSGPRGMVTSFSDQLQALGIPRRHIKKDFFPGFA